MTYLYGDSTDSGLSLNYIELLKSVLVFGVQVAQSEQRIKKAMGDVDVKRQEANAELERLRNLNGALMEVLGASKSDSGNSATNQAVAALHKATEDTLRVSAEKLKRSLTDHEAKVVISNKQERSGTVRLIRELLNLELPDSNNNLDLILGESGSYEVVIRGGCKLGLSWVFEGRIPEGHGLSQVCKVANLMPELAIELPEETGFVRKSVKLKSYRLSSMYITEFRQEPSATHLKLCVQPIHNDDSTIEIRFAAGRVSVVRTHKGETSEPFECEQNDCIALSALCKDLSEESIDLLKSRDKLVEVLFQNKPVADCSDPTKIVTALIERIGPTVQKIAKHSLSDNELVLKQVLSNNRREEIFVSKADLIRQLIPVPDDLRFLFAPLGLGDIGMTTTEATTIPLQSLDDTIPPAVSAVPTEALGDVSGVIDRRSGAGTVPPPVPK